MGGRGSTRWHRYRPMHDLTTDYVALRVGQVVRAARRGDGQTGVGKVVWFKPNGAPAHDLPRYGVRDGVSVEGRLVLHPVHQHQLARDDPAVPLYLMPRRLVSGGFRWWLLCLRCGRWFGALFLTGGDYALRCRCCARLHYPSQRMTPNQRRLEQLLRLVRRVVPYADNPLTFPARQPRQWRKRYERLLTAWRVLRFERRADRLRRARADRWRRRLPPPERFVDDSVPPPMVPPDRVDADAWHGLYRIPRYRVRAS